MQTVGQTDITRISFLPRNVDAFHFLSLSRAPVRQYPFRALSSSISRRYSRGKRKKKEKWLERENNFNPIRQPFHSHFLVTAAMICGGLVMYPIGWDNREVRESCGKGANVYNLGEYLSFISATSSTSLSTFHTLCTSLPTR